jgi:hypothetical protein
MALRGEKNVGRLDVAMDDAVLVRSFEGVRDFDGAVEKLRVARQRTGSICSVRF